jgi:hypothetical protein
LFEVFYPLAGVDGTGTGAWLVIFSSTIFSIKKRALKLNKKIWRLLSEKDAFFGSRQLNFGLVDANSDKKFHQFNCYFWQVKYSNNCQ